MQLADGKTHVGKVVDWTRDGIALRLAVGKRTFRPAELLFFQAPAKRLREPAPMIVDLRDGTRLQGKILGGDQDGDHLQLENGIFALESIQLDRIRQILVAREGRFPAPGQLRLKSDPTEQWDILFRRAPYGVDPIEGSIHRVSREGIHFASRHREDSPELFKWEEIGAARIEGEASRERTESGSLVILTADGSLLRGVAVELNRAMLGLETPQLGRLDIPVAEILAGHVEEGQRSWLSELEPTSVEERSFPAGTEAPLLFPFHRDESVIGQPLAVRSSYWTRGLGCHSYSKLSYRVPAGMRRFLCWVGADDSALGSEPPGNMSFRILLDGKLEAERPSVKGGQAASRIAPIAVKGGQLLTLELGFGEDLLFSGDRGNWLCPVLLR